MDYKEKWESLRDFIDFHETMLQMIDASMFNNVEEYLKGQKFVIDTIQREILNLEQNQSE